MISLARKILALMTAHEAVAACVEAVKRGILPRTPFISVPADLLRRIHAVLADPSMSKVCYFLTEHRGLVFHHGVVVVAWEKAEKPEAKPGFCFVDW